MLSLVGFGGLAVSSKNETRMKHARGAPGTHNTAAAYMETKAAIEAMGKHCAVCAVAENNIPNCCADGASWAGKCTPDGEITWLAGYDVCNGATSKVRVSAAKVIRDKRVTMNMSIDDLSQTEQKILVDEHEEGMAQRSAIHAMKTTQHAMKIALRAADKKVELMKDANLVTQTPAEIKEAAAAQLAAATKTANKLAKMAKDSMTSAKTANNATRQIKSLAQGLDTHLREHTRDSLKSAMDKVKDGLEKAKEKLSKKRYAASEEVVPDLGEGEHYHIDGVAGNVSKWRAEHGWPNLESKAALVGHVKKSGKEIGRKSGEKSGEKNHNLQPTEGSGQVPDLGKGKHYHIDGVKGKVSKWRAEHGGRGKPGQHNTMAAYMESKAALESQGRTCDKCKDADNGMANCCAKGASWDGLCSEKEGAEYTWLAGYDVCNGGESQLRVPLGHMLAKNHNLQPTSALEAANEDMTHKKEQMELASAKATSKKLAAQKRAIGALKDAHQANAQEVQARSQENDAKQKRAIGALKNAHQAAAQVAHQAAAEDARLNKKMKMLSHKAKEVQELAEAKGKVWAEAVAVAERAKGKVAEEAKRASQAEYAEKLNTLEKKATEAAAADVAAAVKRVKATASIKIAEAVSRAKAAEVKVAALESATSAVSGKAHAASLQPQTDTDY